MKTNLLDLTFAETEKFVLSLNLPKFRAKQIREWIYRGVSDFDEMTNLSKEIRAVLKENAFVSIPKVHDFLQSTLDETCKFLFVYEDGLLVESVLMKYKYGYSACISTQAGCKMGCKFCASSGIKFSRDLTSGEILGQILAINRHNNVTVGHVVLMGIGEPMDNYDNVVKFLRNVSSEDGLNISLRKISLSTCGVVPGIYKLAKEDMPVTLSISLHNPFDEERSEIMPINRKYCIKELMQACRDYVNTTGRRITFEYSLISGVNDSQRHAKALSEHLKGMLCHVNLIPVNTVSGTGFLRPDKKVIEGFSKQLESYGVSVTVRRELGKDISAACGQLRKQNINE